MNKLAEYELSKYQEIETLNDKGRTILVFDTVKRELFVKKTVDKDTYKIYKAIEDIEIKFMPKIVETIKADEEYIIIEEFIKGDTIDALINKDGKIKKNVFSEEKAISYTIDIGEALKEVHGRNIVHRDISPNNVIIDENDRAILLDFDNSRIYKENKSRDTVLMGTNGFAAPEQRGYIATDARGDIYSLGNLLNYMLTGNVVQNEIYKKTGLYNVISKAVKFDPEDRYYCIEDFIDDLSVYCPNRIKTSKNSRLWRKMARHLPGFRTNKVYRKIIAIMIYIFGIWLFVAQLQSSNRSLSDVISDMIYYFIMFVFPMWFFGARGEVLKKFKILRELKPLPRYIMAVIFYFILQFIVFTTIE